MCWLKYQGTWTEQRVSKFWLHEDMQHLHSGGMLSPKFASFPYIFPYLFHSPKPPKLSISCAKEHLTWFLIIFLCLLFDLDFVHSAAESCHFPQLLQLSAAILWNSMLQVSTRETSHMGRSGMTWTWFVSYWFKQTHPKKPRSKASTWKSTMEFHVGRTLFRVTWRFIRPFLSLRRINRHLYRVLESNSSIHLS